MLKNFSITVLRNSAFGVGAHFTIKLLSFVFTVLIVRNLGPTIYGQYAAVLAFTEAFAVLSDLGLSPYSVRQIARWREAENAHQRASSLYGNVILIRMILSLITLFVVVGAAWLTGRPIVLIGAIGLNALVFFLYAVQGANEAVLSGFERLDIISVAQVFYRAFFVVAGGAVLLLKLGYFGLIVANLFGVSLLALICWRRVKILGISFGPINPREWLNLLRASIPFGIIGFALGLSYKFDSILLNITRSDAETGFYNAAYSLVFSLVFFSNALNTSLYPSISRESVRNPTNLPRIYSRVIRYLAIASLPIAFGATALASKIIPFLYGQKYLEAIPAFRILIWVLPLMFFSEFLGYVVVIDNKEKYVARAVLISTSLNVLFNLLLVPRFGLMAAASMTVFTEIILVSQYIFSVRGSLKQIQWSKSIVKPVIAAFIMAVLVVVADKYLSLFVCIAFGALIYLALLIILRIFGIEEFRWALSLRKGQDTSV